MQFVRIFFIVVPKTECVTRFPLYYISLINTTLADNFGTNILVQSNLNISDTSGQPKSVPYIKNVLLYIQSNWKKLKNGKINDVATLPSFLKSTNYFERGKTFMLISWFQNWILGSVLIQKCMILWDILQKRVKKGQFLLVSPQNWPLYRGGCPLYRENFNIEVYGSETGI